MGPTALALVFSAPMQLAAAAGVEVSGGYDSTVVNALTQTFGDGGILRTGVTLQLGHRTETLRQTLRASGEMYFAGGEGRDFEKPNIMSFNRYTLTWTPDDDWRIGLTGTYNVGQGYLLFQRAADPSATMAPPRNFVPGVFGEYGGNGEFTRVLSDVARLVLNAGINGRHTIEVPRGTPRADMSLVSAGLTGSREFGESTTLGLTGSAQMLQMLGLGDALFRVTGFATWRRQWAENTNTNISGGVDSLQDQNDPTRTSWNLGPYASATFTQVIPDANLAISLRGRYEFSSVNGVRCATGSNGQQMLTADGACAQVLAGGAGRIVGGALQLLWRPLEDSLVFTGTVSMDHGVTDNLIPALMGGAASTRAVANDNLTALANVRWIISRGVSVFARYTFLYQYVDPPNYPPEVVRHVGLVGVTLTAFAGEAEQLGGVVPAEEAAAAAAIRSAAGESANADANADPNAERSSVLDEPLVDEGAPTQGTQGSLLPSQLPPGDPSPQPTQPINSQVIRAQPNELLPPGAPPATSPSAPRPNLRPDGTPAPPEETPTQPTPPVSNTPPTTPAPEQPTPPSQTSPTPPAPARKR